MSLAAENVNLAYWVASRLRAPDPDAVRSEALLGLVEAERAYDPARGRFASLAAHVCRQRAGAELRRQRRCADREVSFYYVGSSGEEEARTELPSVAPIDGARIMALRVREAVAGLDPRERNIIERRYGIDREAETLAAIGADLGLSSSRIGQLERMALRALRRALSRKGLRRC